jgi:tetratricopeptide (TPR) repeat protein
VLNRELANLRAGIAHDLTAAPAAALRTAGLLEWFWYRGGHVADGLGLLSSALAGAPGAPANDRARAWAAMATLRFLTGDADQATGFLREAVAALPASPDHEGRALRAQAHFYESLLHSALGDYDRATACGRQAMDRGAEIGETWLVAAGAMTLGWALVGRGELDQGRRRLREAITTAASIDQRWMRAMSELLLARALLRDDGTGADPEAALVVLERAVTGFDDDNDVGNVLAGLQTSALALAMTGRFAEAATLAAAVRRAAVRRGLKPEAADPLGVAATTALLAGTTPATESGDLDEPAMIARLRTAVASG